MALTPSFLLTGYTSTWVGTTLHIVTTSDIACHMWLRWTNKELRMHKLSMYIRGVQRMGHPYYCFVEGQDIEQQEPGDTLTHTFDFPSWYLCLRRWWYFWATIASSVSPTTTAVFTEHYKGPEEVTIPVAASTDDCYVWLAHNIYLTATDCRFGHVPGHYWYAGFRFLGIPLTPLDTVEEAEIRYKAAETIGSTWIRLHGEANPAPATFSTMADFFARPRTTDVGRTPFYAMTKDTWYTQNVLLIIREIIALPGWKIGNPIVIFFDGDPLGSRRQSCYAYDSDPTWAAQLYIKKAPSL